MVKNTCLMAITTPDTEGGGWFNQMIEMKENGKKMLNVYKFQEICDKCIKKNLDPSKGCEHVKDFNCLKDEPVKKKWELVCKKMDLDTNQIELSGLPPSRGDVAFSKENIDWLRKIKRDYFETEEPYEVVFAIDPNGGGRNRAGLLIAYLDSKTYNLVIVGIDRVNCRDGDKMCEMIIANHDLFNNIFGFEKSKKIFVVESNGNFSGFMTKLFFINNYTNNVEKKKYLNNIFFYEELDKNKNSKTGFTKTAKKSSDYITLFNQALIEKRIHFHKNFFSTLGLSIKKNSTEEFDVSDSKSDTTFKKLKEELCNELSYILKQDAKNDIAKTMKNLKNSGKANNDIAVSAMCALYILNMYASLRSNF